MRSEEEVQDVHDRLGQSDPEHPGVVLKGQENPLLDWKGDSFRYGYLVGKLVALGWVLGDPAADLVNHYDYEDWLLEQRSMRGSIPPPE